MALRATTNQSGFPVQGEVRGFRVVIDEPASLGGTDKAPNPVEYLLLAQASCLSIVITTLAQQRGIGLKRVSVDANSEFELGEFLEGKAVGLRWIDLEVSVDSDAKPDIIRELVDEAERICPVKNTISARVRVRLKTPT